MVTLSLSTQASISCNITFRSLSTDYFPHLFYKYKPEKMRYMLCVKNKRNCCVNSYFLACLKWLNKFVGSHKRERERARKVQNINLYLTRSNFSARLFTGKHEAEKKRLRCCIFIVQTS